MVLARCRQSSRLSKMIVVDDQRPSRVTNPEGRLFLEDCACGMTFWYSSLVSTNGSIRLLHFR